MTQRPRPEPNAVLNGNVIKVNQLASVQDTRIACHLIATAEARLIRSITLDLSSCEHITASGMIPLLAYVDARRAIQRTLFYVNLPSSAEHRSYIEANWAGYIQEADYQPPAYDGGQVEARRYKSDEEMHGIFEDLLYMVLSWLSVDRQVIAAFEWSLYEVMENVMNHSNSPSGGFVQASVDQGENCVEFIVADAGIGVVESIGIEDPEEALKRAISEGVTRNKQTNMGNGLFGAFRASVLSQGGKFEMHSGYGFLTSGYGEAEPATGRATPSYPGTAVRCLIGMAQPDLLEIALRFGGKPHQPVYDVVERRYESEEGGVVIIVKEDASKDIGSRQGGQRVRQRVENLLRDQPAVEIDFDGVGVISSSFADEVFGRLFVDLGPLDFNDRVEIVNASSTIKGLINRAIVQRTRVDDEE